jgi:hypothetical protein
MEEQNVHDNVRRYLDGAAAAGFVVVWTTLGFETALLATLAALAAVHAPRLATLRVRRPAPARPRRSADDEYQLVPDDPSLVLTPAEL